MMENQPQIISVPKIHGIQTNRIYFLFAVVFSCCPSTQNGEHNPLNSHWVLGNSHQFMAPTELEFVELHNFFLGTFILSVQYYRVGYVSEIN